MIRKVMMVAILGCALATMAHAQGDVSDLVLKADILVAKGNCQAAIGQYKQALVATPDAAALHNKMGICYQRTEQIDAALQAYQRAVAVDSSYAEAWNNIGSVHHAAGDYDEAVAAYEKGLEIKPLAVIYKNLGTVHLAEERIEAAFASYRKAFELDPAIFGSELVSPVAAPGGDLAMQYYYFAKLCAASGLVEKAATFFEKAQEHGFKDLEKVRNDPDFASVMEDVRFALLLEEEA